jgi:glycosyltransferase involved in cell wall biosynthesis
MYNALKTIDLAIESVLNQKLIDIKVIIIDHGSEDGGYEHVKEKYHAVNNLLLHRLDRTVNERRSASRPLNTGFRLALDLVDWNLSDQTYLIRLDADDVFFSDDALANIFRTWKPSVKFLNGQIIMYNNDTKKASSYSPKSHINNINALLIGGAYAMAHHASLISPILVKTLFERDGYCYMENTGYGEDLDFSLRLLKLCDESEFVMCFESVIIKKLDGDSISNGIGLKDVIADHLRIFRKHTSLSRSLLLKIIIWFLFRSLGRFGNFINSRRKPPAYQYAEIKDYPYDEVMLRYKMILNYRGKSNE